MQRKLTSSANCEIGLAWILLVRHMTAKRAANAAFQPVGDPTALPGLLDQIDAPVSWFLADGAYDGTPTKDLLQSRFGEAVEIIIPPPKIA